MQGDTATLSDVQENMHVEVHKAINEKPSVRFMCLPK